MSVTTSPVARKYYAHKDLPVRTSLSRVTIWRMQKSGEFPPMVQLSPGRVGCPVEAVEAWLESRQTVGA